MFSHKWPLLLCLMMLTWNAFATSTTLNRIPERELGVLNNPLPLTYTAEENENEKNIRHPNLAADMSLQPVVVLASEKASDDIPFWLLGFSLFVIVGLGYWLGKSDDTLPQ